MLKPECGKQEAKNGGRGAGWRSGRRGHTSPLTNSCQGMARTLGAMACEAGSVWAGRCTNVISALPRGPGRLRHAAANRCNGAASLGVTVRTALASTRRTPAAPGEDYEIHFQTLLVPEVVKLPALAGFQRG